jgi:hypothetical protein
MNQPRPDDDEPDDHFYDDEAGCPECMDGTEPDAWQSACPDDLCHGGAVPCMHGDYTRLACNICGK